MEIAMRKLLYVALVALPIVGYAADKSPDASFYKNAAEGGMSEVELGNLAQEKGQSQAVKDFGQMMVHDHSAANDKLKGIASSKGIDLPTSSSVGQMATMGKLKVLSGNSFDKSYVKGMVQDHQEDIKEFEMEAQNGKDPEARQFAQSTLPTLKAHLSKIQAIAASNDIASN
jgi:putative membrane protein